MFYVPELLTRRGKLSTVWFAATLREILFMKHCNRMSIMGIDLDQVCDEIEKNLNVNERSRERRFSLYLSSQLLFGAMRIELYQTRILEVRTKKIISKILHISREPSKAQTTINFDRIDFDIIDAPIDPDGNNIVEILPPTPERSRHCTFEDPIFTPLEALPGFGPVPSDLFSEYLDNFRRIPYLKDAIENELSNRERVTDFNDEGVNIDSSSQPVAPGSSIGNSPDVESPKERRSRIRRASQIQTPTKRQRIVEANSPIFQREVAAEKNNPQEDEQSPLESHILADPTPELPVADLPVGHTPEAPVVDSQMTHADDVTDPASLLSIPEIDCQRPRKLKRKRKIFRDEKTHIGYVTMRNQINNLLGYTRSKKDDFIDLRKTHNNVTHLMSNPSTLWHFGIKHRFARNLTSFFSESDLTQRAKRVFEAVRESISEERDFNLGASLISPTSVQRLPNEVTDPSILPVVDQECNFTNEAPHEGTTDHPDIPNVGDSHTTFILSTESPHQPTNPEQANLEKNSDRSSDFMPHDLENPRGTSIGTDRDESQSSRFLLSPELQISETEIEAEITRKCDEARRNGIRMPLEFTHIFPPADTTKARAANAFFHILGIVSKENSNYYLQQEYPSLELFITSEE